MKKASLFKHFALCVAFQAAAIPAAMAQEKPPEPARADRYASIVIDAQTGNTLYARDGDQQLRPASTTKVMTAYLTFEALRAGTLTLDQELTVSRRAATQERTNLAMIRPVTITDKKTGKKRTENQQVIRKITVEDALKGMLVHSANDAAVVLAEAIGGSLEGFADKMNAAATKIGMNDSHFMNPNGLPHTQQYSTVSDMAKLSAAVIAEYPEYYHFFSTRTFRYNGTNYRNYNNLLGSYDGVDGLKTGYIRTSGFNLAASAERDGQRIIAVVFGADNPTQRKADMTVLLDYGFAVLGSQPKPPLPANDTLPPDDSEDPEETAPGFQSEGQAKAPVTNGIGFFAPQPARQTGSLSASYTLASFSLHRAHEGSTIRPTLGPAPLPEKDLPGPEKQPLYAQRTSFPRGREI
ncbi:MAG: D-alanyl-D-alanine carboxypeptidase family protein [Alphaproteobacteria bacterium]|nr:D-alanyl-D-alanine carboxypeptidase family protein [Alphaproteobacteria bacterium]